MAYKQKPFSPFTQEAPRDESLNPVGPRGQKGNFKTITTDDGLYSYGDKEGRTPTTVETKPITRTTSTGSKFPTGETKVVETSHTTYKKDGKKYSKIRGIVPHTTTEISTIGQKGKQKGDTTVHDSEGAGPAKTYKKSGKKESFFGEETDAREFDPTRREFK